MHDCNELIATGCRQTDNTKSITQAYCQCMQTVSLAPCYMAANNRRSRGAMQQRTRTLHTHHHLQMNRLVWLMLDTIHSRTVLLHERQTLSLYKWALKMIKLTLLFVR